MAVRFTTNNRYSIQFAKAPITDYPMSMCFWGKTRVDNNQVQYAMSYGTTNSFAAQSALYSSQLSATAWGFQQRATDGGGGAFTVSFQGANQSAALDKLTHVCIVQWSSANRSLFLDGVETNNTTDRLFLTSSEPYYLTFGVESDSAGTSWYDGDIKDAAMFDYALTEGQIREMAFGRRRANQIPGKAPVVYFPFNGLHNSLVNLGTWETGNRLIKEGSADITTAPPINLNDVLDPTGMKAIGKRRVAGRVVEATEGW